MRTRYSVCAHLSLREFDDKKEYPTNPVSVVKAAAKEVLARHFRKQGNITVFRNDDDDMVFRRFLAFVDFRNEEDMLKALKEIRFLPVVVDLGHKIWAHELCLYASKDSTFHAKHKDGNMVVIEKVPKSTRSITLFAAIDKYFGPVYRIIRSRGPKSDSVCIQFEAPSSYNFAKLLNKSLMYIPECGCTVSFRNVDVKDKVDKLWWS